MNLPLVFRSRFSDTYSLLRSLPLLLAFSLPLNAATYYVDYASGNDAGTGGSAETAWKHCPGDAAAGGVAAGMSLAPGDTVLFKGGVTYVFTGQTGIALRSNGAFGSPITYDGNSAGTWGTGRAIFTDQHGAASLTAFSASQPASYLIFKHLEIAAIGGSASLPADAGSAVAPRFGGGIAFAAGASNTTIENCVFRDLGYAFNQKPMGATSIAGTAITLRGATAVTINNCDFSRLTLGVDLSGTASASNVKITSCTFRDSIVWPLEIPASAVSGVSIYSCTEGTNSSFSRSAWTGYGESPRVSSYSVAAGGSVTLTASASATPAASFQWQKDGQPIVGASNQTLTRSAVSLADAGVYTVTATNAAGSAVSHEAVLTVTGSAAEILAPAFTTHPVSQTVATSSTVSFTVAVSGSPTPTIQWFRDGATSAGWTGSTLTLPSVSSSDAGNYVAVATNTVGSVTSNSASLVVTNDTTTSPSGTAPVITAHPESQTAAPLSTVILSVTASGSPTPTIQWFRDGVTYSSWTGSSLVLYGVSSADAGNYVAHATNSAGSVMSNAASLTVGTTTPPPPATTAPVITTQPVSQTVASLGSVTFSVAASGSPTPTIQWFRNGTALAGATQNTLALSNVSSTDAGNYLAVASNSAGSATSNTATLTVESSTSTPPPTSTPPSTSAPVITSQPTSQTVEALSTVIFSVTATGSPTPTIQWYRDGVTYGSWAGSSLVIYGASSADAGNYTAVATNSAGSVTSNPATLTIGSSTVPPPTSTPEAIAPVIVTQPVSLSVDRHGTATFTVVATGTPAPTYTWYRNGITFPGWTNATLTLSAVTSNDAGAYTVVVTNAAGTVTSNAATLSIAKGKSDFRQIVGDDSTVGSTPQRSDVVGGSRLVNLSVRSTAGSGNDSLIVGFVVSGGSEKSLLIRGSGPALDSFGVSGVLSDPTLALYSGSALLAANDDWSAATDAASIAPASASAGAFTLPEASRDAALLTNVSSGAYTGQVSGKDSASGIALIELYDLAPNTQARLVNVSVRTIVTAAGEAPVIGFVVAGTEPKRLLVRAIGPALAAFGLSDTIADPQLEIYEGSTRLQHNDNWAGSAELEDAFARVGAFPLADAAGKDAALLVTAAPGAYTAVVSGVNNASGTVLVEVYELP